MSRFSLRARLIVASILWTGGMLALMHLFSMLLIHTLPRFRREEPALPVALGIVSMCAGFWWARSGLTPFRKLREQVTEMREGERRRIEGAYPSEVAPLIESINALVEHREKSIERAFSAAGDLAHALKTPLALLASEAAAAETAGQTELAEAIRQQIRRMTSQVDYHLARARVAASGPAGTVRCPLAPCADALVRTVAKLYAERGLEITAQVDAEAAVRVRREDLDEILGNVLDNACKWARARVTLGCEPEGSKLLLVVDDDGPGLPEPMRRAVLERGVRLDESAPGSGLGLSIVRDLTEHYGGTVELSESHLGGLCVRISLPAA